MHGPLVETVLLLLLVVFFGIQQRQRPQLYFRIWTVGWVLVFLSLSVWVVDLRGSSDGLRAIQEGARYDLILLAGLAFATSPVLTRSRLRRTVVQIGILLLPLLVGLGLMLAPGRPGHIERVLELILIVGSQVGGVALVLLSVPAEWKIRKPALTAICATSTVWILIDLIRNPGADVGNIVLAQVFLCAGVHYLATYGRTLSGVMGGVGLSAWGLFYLLPDALLRTEVTLHAIYIFWNIPIYIFWNIPSILWVSRWHYVFWKLMAKRRPV